jgi:hypothetical protein
MFETFEAAARALLLTTCQVLNESSVEYTIVGGWVPVLRGGRQDLFHPGTRDVDVLLSNRDPSVVKIAAEKLLDRGFTPSAKHEFQLLRQVRVGERDFLFNIDLMHPAEQTANPELFSDIFDLGAPDSNDPTGKRWLKSIIFQSAHVVFDRALWSHLEVDGLDLEGQRKAVRLPLLNEAGLILSKTKSVQQAKRPRDAFDIYYVSTGPGGAQAAATIQTLVGEIEEIADQVKTLQIWLSSPENSKVFDRNVRRYSKIQVDDPTIVVLRALSSAPG